MKNKIIIGSRGSKLALIYAERAKTELLKNSEIEINAIGIGHDVTNYYEKAIKIADVQELGDAMVDQLVALFINSPAKKRILN